jgi:hypothetical protein
MPAPTDPLESPTDVPATTPVRSAAARWLLVSIELAGEWPTVRDLVLRRSVVRELETAGLARSVGGGAGAGQLELVLQTTDATTAELALTALLERYFPGRAARCRTVE